jgi:hypothetical protein
MLVFFFFFFLKKEKLSRFDETSKIKLTSTIIELGLMGDFIGGLIYVGQQHKCPLLYILLMEVFVSLDVKMP